MHELNAMAFESFKQYRLKAYLEKWRTSQNKRYPAWTLETGMRTLKRLKNFPPHVQQNLVFKAIDSHWQGVQFPKNTLDYDKPNGAKPTHTHAHSGKIEEMITAIATAKEMPKKIKQPQRSEAQLARGKKAIGAILDKLKDDEDLITGSDRDPNWRS